MPELNTDYDPNILGKAMGAMRLKRTALENAILEPQVANAPEMANLEMQQKQQEIQKGQFDLETLKSIAPMEKAKAWMQNLVTVGSRMDFNGYKNGGYRALLNAAAPLGEDVNTMANNTIKPPEEIEKEAAAKGMLPQQYFNEVYKKNVGMIVPEQLKQFEAETKRIEATADVLRATKEKWSEAKNGIDEKGNPIVYQVNEKGESRIVQGVHPEAKKGMRVYDANGNLILDTTGGEMTPKSKGEIEGKITGGSEQLARIQAISSEFKPEYQEVGARLSNAWTSIKARLGQGVSKEDMEKLTDFKKFQRKSIENINLYIRELTGAQMSEKEGDRLKLAQPDPGEKWYKGDDPITFKAKLGDVEKYTRASIARYNYYLKKGFNDDQIKKMINDGSAESLDSIAGKMK